MKLRELYDKIGVPQIEDTTTVWDAINRKYDHIPTGKFIHRTGSRYAKDRTFLKSQLDKDCVIYYKKLGEKTFFSILMYNKLAAYFYASKELDYVGNPYFDIARFENYSKWKKRMEMTDDYMHTHQVFDEYKDPISDVIFVTEVVTK